MPKQSLLKELSCAQSEILFFTRVLATQLAGVDHHHQCAACSSNSVCTPEPYFHLRESNSFPISSQRPSPQVRRMKDADTDSICFSPERGTIRDLQTHSSSLQRVRAESGAEPCLASFTPEPSAFYPGNWSLMLISLCPFSSMNNHVLLY